MAQVRNVSGVDRFDFSRTPPLVAAGASIEVADPAPYASQPGVWELVEAPGPVSAPVAAQTVAPAAPAAAEPVVPLVTQPAEATAPAQAKE